MPRETHLRAEGRARARAILLGHNLPLLLWTSWATLVAFLGDVQLWPCPVKALCGTCFGCGLTRQYAGLLRGDGCGSTWLLVVLLGFAINAAWSVVTAVRDTASIADGR